jgi:hypothetical protein
VLKEVIRLEGEEKYKQDEKISSFEDKLIANDPVLYVKSVVEALKERITENQVNINDLGEDIKKLIDGKITDVHQVKLIKNQAVKKIGELGAKSK